MENTKITRHFRSKAFIRMFFIGILPIATALFLIFRGDIYSRNEMFIFSVLVFLAVALLSVMFADRLAKPIKALEAGASAILQGEFSPPINIKTHDETKYLAEAINKMGEGMQELQFLKDEVIFIASHELKEPVMSAQQDLSKISNGSAGYVSDEAKNAANKVIVSNKRLLKLAEDMIRVARFESEGIKIEVVPVDFPAVVQFAIADLQIPADVKSIKIKYSSSDMPKVMADEGFLREIMIDLIGNAIKYTPTGGEVVILHEISGDRVVTRVKDKGIGIPPEALDNLFHKFYRVADPRVPDDHGAGLGLFITKYLVEKMNGSISVESVYGAGTTVSFSLPDIVLKNPA